MKKILAIDDQVDNLITIKAVIKSRIQNCNVITALSGKDGIEIAIKEQPDTILLDIIMPDMDGFETCKRLKENELTKHIPVIMVTAIKTDSDSRVKGLNIGADAFLSKPIDAIELTAQVNVMLRIKEAEDKLRGEKDLLEELVLERTRDLKISEEKYHSIFDGAKDGIIYISKDLNVLAVNKAFTEITGIAKEDIVGKHGLSLAKNFINTKQLPEILNIGKEMLLGKKATNFTVNYQDKILELSSQQLENGRSVFIMRDVTVRKKAEKEIRKLSTAVEQSPSVIIITDLEGKIEYVNPKFSELTGYTSKAVIGKNPRILKSGEQSTATYKKMWDAISSGKEWRGELQNKKKNGDLFWESAIMSPIFDKQGKVTNYIKVAEDITEKKLAEDAIRKSEALYRNLVHVLPDGVYKSTNEGKFVNVNPAMVKMLGYASKEELLAIDIKTQLYFEIADRESVVLKENLKETGIFRMKKKDGSEIWVEDHGWLTIDKNTNATFHEGVMRDITERKRTEEIQKILYNISNAVIKTNDIRDLIHIVQKELGTIIDTKNFYVALYNSETNTISSPYMADEKDSFTTFPAGKTLTYYVIKTQKPLLATKKRLKELEDSGDIEGIGTDSEIWLGVPLKIEGKVTGVFAVQSYTDENAYDETDMEVLEFIADQISISIERKTADDLLKKSEERFDLAVNASRDGLYDWNLITDEVYYSENWKTMLGYTDEELPNDISVWKSLSHKGEKEASLLKLKEAIDQKIDHYDVEFRMKHKLGHWVNILSRAQLIYNNKGEAIRAVGTHVDLTEQKKAEQNLKEALSKAEESDRLKSAFLANMSHEIRTPMNGILGFSQLLKEPNLEGDEQLKFINIIENSGKRMLNIINDLIDISKIEAGQAEIKISEVELNKQTEYLYTFFKPEAEKAGLQLSFKNTLSNPLATIKSDREKIYAILTNLIKNAIKYTKKGSIEFGYNLRSATGSTSSQAQLEFYVKDTGIGIAQDKQEAIFDRFVQADTSLASDYEGAGLGLAITKGYVEILGGNLWVESIEGEGSQFYFTIPYHIKSDQENIETSNSKSTIDTHQRKLNILIAEDDENSQFFLTALTKSICKEVTYAKTGLEAIDICKKKQNIDLILMDIKMPEMDGYEASRKIREFNENVIIIAQTAYALEGDREKAIEAGCNDYISKPISKDKLFEIVWKHLEK